MGRVQAPEDFIKMSKYAGMCNDHVQAGGGNTSVKWNETCMVIKASGYQLTDITRDEGYAVVDYPRILRYFEADNPISHDEKGSAEILQQALISGKRPSIETFLHAVTGKYTLHSHPAWVNVLTARKNGMQELKALFPEALMVDYTAPGIWLADRYFAAFREAGGISGEGCGIIFLKNHGLVVTADTAERTMELHEQILQKISGYLGLSDSERQEGVRIFQALYEQTGNIVFRIRNTEELKRLSEKYGGAGWNHVFAPDCLIYCGRKILDLGNEEEISAAWQAHSQKYGAPKVAFRNGCYYALAPNLKKAHDIESVLQFCAKVCLLNEGQETDYLSPGEQDLLLGLDSEKYRQNLKQ